MSEIDIERIERAIKKLAVLIDETGEDFWPILERLEAERDKILSRKQRLERYLGTELAHYPKPDV
ncbi:hypothetical protein [Henriciella aquimarina]|uniref:hypothetical protein n=1 Tax=Henriciella aquimarina TaxID=545261 RepID=UPI000A009953|nr:hypothetical protein [Henriciella aquimarina]